MRKKYQYEAEQHARERELELMWFGLIVFFMWLALSHYEVIGVFIWNWLTGG